MKRMAMMTVVVLGLVEASAGVGCSKAPKKGAPSAPASAAPSSTSSSSAGVSPAAVPSALSVPIAAALDWGLMQDETDTSGPNADVHKIVLDVTPNQPVVVRVPKGSTLQVSAPEVPKVEPLAKSHYTFEISPREGKAEGFMFKTSPSLDRDMVMVEVKPGAKAGEYQVHYKAGAAGTEKPEPMQAECETISVPGWRRLPNASADTRAAFAALSAELEQALPKFKQPAEMLRVMTRAFDRTLINVDRLRRAVDAKPCGSGSLEFVCPKTTCVIRQLGQDRTMKKGDSLTLGLGTSVEFVSMRD